LFFGKIFRFKKGNEHLKVSTDLSFILIISDHESNKCSKISKQEVKNFLLTENLLLFELQIFTTPLNFTDFFRF